MWKQDQCLHQTGLFSDWTQPQEESETYVETVLSRVEIKADGTKKAAIVDAFKVIYSLLNSCLMIDQTQ